MSIGRGACEGTHLVRVFSHLDDRFQLGKFDQINQEYHRHITLLERSIEEHKRLIRKRDKEVDDVRKQLDDSKVVYLNSYRKDRRRTKTDCD